MPQPEPEPAPAPLKDLFTEPHSITRQGDLDLPSPQLVTTLLLGRLEVKFTNFATIIHASTDGGKSPSTVNVLFAPPAERYDVLPRDVNDYGASGSRVFAIDGVPATAKHVFVRVVVTPPRDSDTASPILDATYKVIHLTVEAIDNLYKAVGLLAMDTDGEEKVEEEEKKEDEAQKPKEWCGSCTPDEYCPEGCYE